MHRDGMRIPSSSMYHHPRPAPPYPTKIPRFQSNRYYSPCLIRGRSTMSDTIKLCCLRHKQSMKLMCWHIQLHRLNQFNISYHTQISVIRYIQLNIVHQLFITKMQQYTEGKPISINNQLITSPLSIRKFSILQSPTYKKCKFTLWIKNKPKSKPTTLMSIPNPTTLRTPLTQQHTYRSLTRRQLSTITSSSKDYTLPAASNIRHATNNLQILLSKSILTRRWKTILNWDIRTMTLELMRVVNIYRKRFVRLCHTRLSISTLNLYLISNACICISLVLCVFFCV